MKNLNQLTKAQLIEKVQELQKVKNSYISEHQEFRLFHNAKQRAKKTKLEFDLEISDIQIPKVCPFLGVEITNIIGKGRIQSNASLDRIDSSKGYIKGNIRVISDLANRMKQEAAEDQLISFAENILKMFKK